MPLPAMLIDRGDLVLHFDTQDMLDVALFGGLLLNIVELARSSEQLGPTVEARIAEFRTGSLTARLKFTREDFRDGIAVGGLLVALYAALQDPAQPAGLKCAQIMVDQSVSSVELCTLERSFTVPRDNPAVRALEQKRAASPSKDELNSNRVISDDWQPTNWRDAQLSMVAAEHAPNDASNYLRAYGTFMEPQEGKLIFEDELGYLHPVIDPDIETFARVNRRVSIWIEGNPTSVGPQGQSTYVIRSVSGRPNTNYDQGQIT